MRKSRHRLFVQEARVLPKLSGRRMADPSARLTDEVLPQCQWVLSLPFEMRYRLSWDGELVAASERGGAVTTGLAKC